jgi:hypothetical protein
MGQQVVTVTRIGQRGAAINIGRGREVGNHSKPGHGHSMYPATLSRPGWVSLAVTLRPHMPCVALSRGARVR